MKNIKITVEVIRIVNHEMNAQLTEAQYKEYQKTGKLPFEVEQDAYELDVNSEDYGDIESHEIIKVQQINQ